MQSCSKYADIFKALRIKFGLSQEAFADKCQMQSGHVSKIERGLHEPSGHTLKKVAAGFDMSVSDLLLLDKNFSVVAEHDPITFEITSISKILSEKDRLCLLEIAKIFKKQSKH